MIDGSRVFADGSTDLVPGRTGQRDHYYPRCLVSLQPTIRDLATGQETQIARSDIIPLSCTITLDQAERANTCDLEITLKDFPLHPSVVQDCRVVVIMADVELPEVDLYIDNADHGQFIGFVDTYEYSSGMDGPRLRITCRDYSGRLLDQRYDGAPIRTDATLLDIVAGLVAQAPGYERIPITIENDKPLKAFVRTDLWTPPRAGTLWDVLVSLGHAAGQEVAFELQALTFRTARNVPQPRVRTLTQGRTLENVSMSRAPAPLYRKAITLRQIDARTGEVVEGTYPTDVALKDRIVYPVAGQFTAADLQRRAKLAFESVATMAVQGTFETRHMVDDNGEDLCGIESIRSGDTVFIYLATGGAQTPLGIPAGQLVAYLEAAGVQTEDAQRMVASWTDAEELANLFVVRSARHTIDQRGYRLVVEFENLVRAG